jgi:hypothetical protein
MSAAGEKNPNARFTNKQARQIREYRAEGFTYTDIQKLFGGTLSGLNYICCGKTYKDAGGPIDMSRHQHNSSVII